MRHFSRLTDIVTCNLTEILKTSADPTETLKEIISEMAEGLTACRRSATTSSGNYERLGKAIDAHVSQVTDWTHAARQSLAAGDENGARQAVTRKVELEGLIDGLRPEMEAAHATWQHLLRIQRALEARHADAIRRLAELTGETVLPDLESETAIHAASAIASQKASEVDAALEALRREINQK